MSSRRYAHVPSARRPRAAFDVDSRPAAEFCRRLLDQALRQGLPASQSFGRLRALLARSGAVARIPSFALRHSNRRPRRDLDWLAAEIGKAWPQYAGLRALALHRGSGLTVFLFGDGTDPVLVAKVPGDRGRLDAEADALAQAEPSGIAPRYLGLAGEAHVQEGMRGTALQVEPVTPRHAGELGWRPAHADIAAALGRLASTTAHRGDPEQLREPVAAVAETAPELGAEARRAVAAAGRDLRRLERAVLAHSDTSPQNCLVAGGRLTGLVDWELARRSGAPGFDCWNFAVAYLEHCAGLAAWSDRHVLESFRAAWAASPFFREARSAARACALAADVPGDLLDQLEVAFFARRLLVRLAAPGRFPTGPEPAARMLEVVCAH